MTAEDSQGGRPRMEDTGSTSVQKRKEKKYVQGPKLKILPSQLERPAEPPVLLDLLDVRPRLSPQPPTEAKHRRTPPHFAAQRGRGRGKKGRGADGDEHTQMSRHRQHQ